MENNQAIQIIESGDGSHTLFNPALNETYHSTHGAMQESWHVFIQAGLERAMMQKDTIRIFEIGFGTGLNAWLSYKRILDSGKKIEYTSLEPFPLQPEIYEKLNYTEKESLAMLRDFFSELHGAEWNMEVKMNDNFSLHKIITRLENFDHHGQNFDLIYYDAFAPAKQAEVWSMENLRKTYQWLAPGGALVTYCAQGQLKRDLRALGFEVETLAGPPGKKEMTRAVKPGLV